MAYVAQRRTRLSGVDYVPGDVVPVDVVTGHVRNLGLVSFVPDTALKPSTDDDPTTDGGGDPAIGFDPGTLTVAEVLDMVGNDPTIAAAVLDAELAGKNRTTLVQALVALIDDIEAEDDDHATDGGGDGGGDGESGEGVDEGPFPDIVTDDPEDIVE